MLTTHRMRSLSVRITALAVLVGGCLAAGPAPGAPSATGSTCAMSLSPLVAGQSISKARVLGCWDTVGQAERALGIAASALAGADSGAGLAAGQTVIGRDFSSTGFLGSQQIWFASNTQGCSGGATYSFAMPTGFNNATRSAQGFAGCGHNTHYDPPSASGLSILCASACSSMGAMDLKTSFVRWAP